MVSPGCDHCYAQRFDSRVGGKHWGRGVPRQTFGHPHWNEPLAWDRYAARDGVQRKVFCASMADVMDDEAPAGEREKLWNLIDRTPNLIWLLLTKRPHRFLKYLPAEGFVHPNVVLMASVESQQFYAPRMKAVEAARMELEIRGDIRYGRHRHVPMGISYEPALGPLSMRELPCFRPDWVICGGETGPGHRPMRREWAEALLAECRQDGVAFFMKQLSAATPAKAAALIPAELLVREFPEIGV
jgi:protein gp37